MQESKVANERIMRVDGLPVRLADKELGIGTPRSTITDAVGPLEKTCGQLGTPPTDSHRS